MKIGMNLVLWTLAVRTEQFGLLRKLGYEGVEVPITRGNGEGFDEVRRVLDGEGLQCTTLTSLRPDANPVSADARVRRNGIDCL
jgi:D-psicose/D-tagatose/L-ribulose 3-epimerase